MHLSTLPSFPSHVMLPPSSTLRGRGLRVRIHASAFVLTAYSLSACFGQVRTVSLFPSSALLVQGKTRTSIVYCKPLRRAVQRPSHSVSHPVYVIHIRTSFPWPVASLGVSSVWREEPTADGTVLCLTWQ